MNRSEATPHRTGLEIAIVGMACRFPGAKNVEEYWRNLCEGVESISTFTDEELREAGVSPATLSNPNYVRARGVVEGADLFDAAFFGMSGKEAEITDPQHRQLLECAWEALESAGYHSEGYAGSIGIYAGAGMNTYLANLLSSDELVKSIGVMLTGIGNEKDHLTTRISYKLSLKGPAITVQTSCSTSLVAISLACQGLLSGACDMALAGGVSINLPQQTGYFYQEGGINSPDGHCRPFDAAANGTVPGNGVGIVVLKRLEDALKDGDTIHAVIRGSAVNNDGSVKVGYTAPGLEGQAAVIAEAHIMAEVEPETIGYIETHGTATALGDPVEFSALSQVFTKRSPRPRSCALGSVKANVGHLDTAAGVAGLIKATLALRHQVRPPSAYFRSPNPEIELAGTPFYLNCEAERWERVGGERRRAGVSSFGIGGTNAHVVLEEAPETELSGAARRKEQLLVLSARSEAALTEARERLSTYLSDRGEETKNQLADVAYTLQLGRKGWSHRAALVCSEASAGAERLSSGAGLLQGVVAAGQRTRVVFMFPGQGAQYVGMCRELYEKEEAFREALDEVAEALLGAPGGQEVRSALWPEEGGEAAETRLQQTQVAQPALFAVEYAMARVWRGWGVEPWAMIGHSLGEFVAAVLAGVMSLEEGARLVVARGRLMQRMAPGAMVAVGLGEAELQQRIERLQAGGWLSVAAANGPRLSVASGSESWVSKLDEELTQEGIWVKRLRTSHAFHSAMMEPALEGFEVEVRRARLSAPQLPYISNLSGEWVSAAEATDAGYWVRQLRGTVRFWQGLERLRAEAGEGAVFLEVGPGETLTKLARLRAGSENGKSQPTGGRIVPTLRGELGAGGGEVAGLLRAAGELWTAGVELAWEKLNGGERRRRVELPTYPFERQRYWVSAQRPVGDLQVPSAAPALKKKQLEDWFYAPVWKQTVAPLSLGTVNPVVEGSNWLIFADEAGVADALFNSLLEAGQTPVIVRCGEEFASLGANEYVINPGERDDYAALFTHLDHESRMPARIVHLWSVKGAARPVAASDTSREAQQLGFDSLLLLAQVLGDRTLAAALSDPAAAKQIDVVVVSDRVQRVLEAEEIEPAKATLLGPCRVLPQEYPNLKCRSIDIEPPPVGRKHDHLIEQLLAEVLSGEGADPVAYRGESRWVQTFEPVRLSGDATLPSAFRDRGVYFITGGLGGVGLSLAKYLASEVHARLALVSRRGLGNGLMEADVAERLRELESLGAEVLVLQADVTDEQQVRAAAEETQRRFGDISGVIHAAGVVPEGLAQVKTMESAARVLAPKVKGTEVLDTVFGGSRLDFIALCSSLRSLVPRPGTVDYCAANAFLDAFAHARNSRSGTRVLSINWDGWSEVGMSARSAKLGDGAELNGESMSPTEGSEAFGRLMRVSLPQVLVSTQDFNALIKRSRPFSPAGTLQQQGRAQSSRKLYERPELTTPYVAPRNEKEQILAEIWQSLLGVERVGIHDNFFELGGDSVINLQIIARGNQAGLELTPRQVFQFQTIAELAEAAGTSGIEAEQNAVTGPVPLTPIQRWFFEQQLEHRNHWNQAYLMEVSGRLDETLLKEAVGHLLAHHDSLRLRYTQSANGWEQVCAEPGGEVPFETLSLESLPEDEQPRAIEEAAARIQESLNLSEGPLIRVVLFDLGADRRPRLLIVIHHLTVDTVSWRILLDDLYKTYVQLERSHPVELPRKTTSFQQWAKRLVEYAQSEPAQREMDYWTTVAAAPVAPLPVDFEGGNNTIASLRTVTAELNANETQELLREAPRFYHTQINDVLLTAISLSLARWTGDAALLFEMEGHGREALFREVDLSRTIGWFTSLFPVRIQLTKVDDDVASLREVKEQLHRVPNRGIGFGVLRYLSEDGDVMARLSLLPKAEVIFLYLGQYEQELAEDDGTAALRPARETAGPNQSPKDERRHLLEFTAQVIRGRLYISLGYSENLHRETTVKRLADETIATLRSLLERRHTAGTGAYTPSDFPEAALSQDDLDLILAELAELED